MITNELWMRSGLVEWESIGSLLRNLFHQAVKLCEIVARVKYCMRSLAAFFAAAILQVWLCPWWLPRRCLCWSGWDGVSKPVQRSWPLQPGVLQGASLIASRLLETKWYLTSHWVAFGVLSCQYLRVCIYLCASFRGWVPLKATPSFIYVYLQDVSLIWIWIWIWACLLL